MNNFKKTFFLFSTLLSIHCIFPSPLANGAGMDRATDELVQSLTIEDPEEALRAARSALEKGANVDGVSPEERITPLMAASARNELSIVKEFIAAGCSIDAQSATGETALMLAAAKGYFQIVYCLVVEKANPSLTDSKGKTALDHAREGGNGLCRMILNHNK